MEDYHYRIVGLMQKQLCGETTADEKEELEAWLEQSPENRKFYRAWCPEELEKRASFFQDLDAGLAFRHFEQRIGHRPLVFFLKRYMRYAALLLLPLALAVFLSKPDRSPMPSTAEIRPGGYQALLTLEDGRAIPLHESPAKDLPLCASFRVRNSGKEIIYQDTTDMTLSSVFNRLSTPRGGEYHITLSDGSRVYLNAATELKYPVVFSPTKREVYLCGEAYFEVSKDSLRPFYVITDAARIRVYGTKFNINTHHNRMQTVLVEGHIGIRGKQEEREYHLQPSDLATFTPDGRLTDLRQVDTFPYIVWKSGKFVFENKCLEDILDHLALWYDVDIFYAQPSLKTLRFTGHMRKYEQIGVILDAIHRITGVSFRIEGKAITVMP